MNKKGFTLIELLAVIVILSIIALITAPIVVGIITNSRESSNRVSGTNYINAVNTAITKAAIDNIIIENGIYEITKNGNVCIGKLKNDKCSSKELKIDATGNRPIRGNVKINNEVVIAAIVSYKEFSVELFEDGQIKYIPFSIKYSIGEEVTFNPGDGDKTWNVIGEDVDTVTLMLNENLGNTIHWYESNEDNSQGPITAINYLNTLTTNWTNVDPIDEFVYINNKGGTNLPNGYQKIEIIDGIAKIIGKNGNSNTISGITKARLLSLEEFLEISQTLNPNLKEENLSAYIERNLDSFNLLASSLTGTTVNGTDVDDVIAFVETIYPILKDGPRILSVLEAVIIGISNGVEPEYDLTVPILSQHLISTSPRGYWLLTSRPSVSTSAMYANYIGGLSSNVTNAISGIGVRPVITIQKSKLY